jgi:cell division protein FtsZ
MSFNEDLFEFDEEEMSNPTDIKVVGVGGGGNNAVSRMKQLGIRGVEFLAVNTDTQDLQNAQCDETIQIGEKITNGLGSGAQPKVGLKSAQESRDKIKQSLEGADLLFLTAGMGGGTGTGASPVIAELAQELDILTVGVVTRPFEFEGQQRSKKAEAGIESLRDVVDTLIIVPNQRIFDVVDDDDIPLEDAFRKADEVLFHGVHGISEIIIEDGIMNVDFADVRTVMEERGDALMGIGEASGEDRAINAAEQALDCPLLETNEITGAQGVLTNITGSKESLSAQAVREINELVNSRADSEAEVICGTVKDQELGDTLRVTVIATGFPHSERQGSSSSGRAAGSTDPTDRENVIDYDNIDSNKKFKEEPAVERKEQGGDVEIVNSNPASAEENDEEDGDDDDDFDVPTFMRVS